MILSALCSAVETEPLANEFTDRTRGNRREVDIPAAYIGFKREVLHDALKGGGPAVWYTTSLE